MTRRLTTLLILALNTGLADGQQPPTVVTIGPCYLAGGGTVKDCRVAYRSFGRINPARSNVVLIPTWLQGRSEDWVPFLGPRGYVDTTQFHVIVADALGDGHSSSPAGLHLGSARPSGGAARPTPAAVNKSSWDSVIAGASAQGKAYGRIWPLEDFAAQLYAIRRHDISIPFGSNLARAASAIKARVLIIHSPDDHMVTAGPALEFAPTIRAETFTVPSACGHLAFLCEQERMAGAVRQFLAQ